jgi:hypothetical protein
MHRQLYVRPQLSAYMCSCKMNGADSAIGIYFLARSTAFNVLEASAVGEAKDNDYSRIPSGKKRYSLTNYCQHHAGNDCSFITKIKACFSDALMRRTHLNLQRADICTTTILRFSFIFQTSSLGLKISCIYMHYVRNMLIFLQFPEA